MPASDLNRRLQDVIRNVVGQRRLIFIGSEFCHSANFVAELNIPCQVIVEYGETFPRIHEGVRLFRLPELKDTEMPAVRVKRMLALMHKFDPHHKALLVVPPSFDVDRRLLKRPSIGCLTDDWRSIENKSTVDELFKNAGIPTPDHRVIDPSDRHAAQQAYRELENQAGVILSSDIGTGAQQTLHARNQVEFDNAVRDLSRACVSRLRIARFIKGESLTIGGIVLPTKVEPLVILENIVTEKSDGSFEFHGIANGYRPNDAVRKQMSDAATKAGWEMYLKTGYLGAFGLDGIATDSQFLPTEINARYTQGFRNLAYSCPDIPLALANAIVMSSRIFGLRDDHFEGIAEAVREAGLQNPRIDDVELDITNGRAPLRQLAYHYQHDQWQPGLAGNRLAPKVNLVGPNLLVLKNLSGLSSRQVPFADRLANFVARFESDNAMRLNLHRPGTSPDHGISLRQSPTQQKRLGPEIDF